MKFENLRLTLLAGGVGAAKFVQGLARIHDPDKITVISNTADDIERHGLWISPDVDIMMYTLAGVVDPVTGWGIKNDTFETLAALERLGEETWFRLGDRDLATHLFRTSLLARGFRATDITQRLSERLNVRARVLPMTDDRVHTEVKTSRGWMHFQEFFVKHACRPEILDVAYRGAERATPTVAVMDAIRKADVVILCPSNPIASIGPILSLPGIREAIQKSSAPRIAISPLVGGKSLKGPSDRMMRVKGFLSDALGVARFYKGLIDGLIVDHEDARLEKEISQEGIRVDVTETLMTTPKRKEALARRMLEFAGAIHDQHRHSRKKPVLC